MQVTPEVGTELYRWVADECRALTGKGIESETPLRDGTLPRVLDLFCGVGGFGLSVAPYCTSVVGIELSQDAVEAATANAGRNQISNVQFYRGDLLDIPTFHNSYTECDTIIVNPPRRGLGSELCEQLTKRESLENIIYSSCNPETLAKDLELLSQRFIVKNVRAFDMFPLTHHCEVVAVLGRK
jgi:23S rRNA (uracil747-C5)-methyltransferase